ncbi:hypothetical protein ZWY2020_051523 [Hordeum vulgare]|nr:hypothetical protein ZWY2020_051523 [Hordeum vulgare]
MRTSRRRCSPSRSSAPPQLLCRRGGAGAKVARRHCRARAAEVRDLALPPRRPPTVSPSRLDTCSWMLDRVPSADILACRRGQGMGSWAGSSRTCSPLPPERYAA